MADNWRPRPSPLQRLRTTTKTQTPFDLDGRLRQAAPVPDRVYEEEFEGGLACHVGPEPPNDTPLGRLWFDTDEPV